MDGIFLRKKTDGAGHHLGETGTKIGMEKPQRYKGYMLRAMPERRGEPIRWTTDIQIERHEGGKVHVVRHDTADTHDTEAEAITVSLSFGRQIVDGRHPDLPLP